MEFKSETVKWLENFSNKVISSNELIEKYFVFNDRHDAGIMLAEFIRKLDERKPLLMAIPCGGVPVGFVISKILNIPMDLVVCRKIQIPWNREAGYGAVAPDGTVVLNEKLVKWLGFNKEEIERHVKSTLREIKRRLMKFRGFEEYVVNDYGTVIIVDDGIASGYTMLAAVKFIRKLNVKKIIIATPTASLSSLNLLVSEVDKIICLNVRSDILGFAVAEAYKLWYDVSDDEVLNYLRELKDLYIPVKMGKITL